MRPVSDDPLTLALARMQRELARMRRETGAPGWVWLAEFSMPACEREVEVGPYLDGELSEGDRREYEAHLAGCPECVRQLAELRSLSGRFDPVRALTLPRVQRQRLLDLAEAVARGGTSPAADGPAFAQYPGAADEQTEETGEREPNPMRIGPPDRSVRWVRWLTAAAAAIFLFSVIQLFLTHRNGAGGTQDGGPGGIPAIQPTTTGPQRPPNTKKSAVPPPARQPLGEDSP